jgi:hypothetical protein
MSGSSLFAQSDTASLSGFVRDQSTGGLTRPRQQSAFLSGTDAGSSGVAGGGTFWVFSNFLKPEASAVTV